MMNNMKWKCNMMKWIDWYKSNQIKYRSNIMNYVGNRIEWNQNRKWMIMEYDRI